MSPGKKRILLVEDDTNLGFLLVDYLEKNGFDVKLCRDGESGYLGFCNGIFDICILDIMLPKQDGFSLAKKIKEKRKDVPVIFLTAKSLKEDKIRGFGLGVDDYLTKPFDEEELLCRIQAVLMRSGSKKGSEKNIFTIGSYTFDYLNQSLSAGGSLQRLTIKEVEVLRLLCESPGKLVKREEILNQVWGRSDYFTGRSLDVFITRIRKYFSKDPSVKIESIPRSGFILTTVS